MRMAQTRAEHNAQVRTTLRGLRAYRKQHGLCRECGAKAETGRIMCADCRKDKRIYQWNRYKPKPRIFVPAKKTVASVQTERIEHMMYLASRRA
jgi:uncharacterized OB-fold protein